MADVGPDVVHGARHDAHAFAASGLKDRIAGHDAAGDLGYTGVDGITVVEDLADALRGRRAPPAPFSKYGEMLTAGLFFFSNYFKAYE